MLIAESIRMALTELGYETTEPAISYTEALEMIRQDQPDILLLDIQLSGRKDGIDLARKVKEEEAIPFIFLTANSDPATVARAKELHPPAYLVKPFNKEALYTSIEICLHNSASDNQAAASAEKENYRINDALFIRQGTHFHKVKLDDIRYIESENVYIHVHTLQGKMLVRSSIQNYLDLMDAKQFCRVHRSFAVNTNHVDVINAESLLINKVEIPVSKLYRDDLLRFFRLG